jgi:hypothetical protein
MKFMLLLLFAAGTAAAQSPKANWPNVQKIQIGQEIQVFLADGKSFRGPIQSVTGESLVVVAATSQQSLARAQILKVRIKGPSHRARNTLIGLALGTGSGLAIGAGLDHSVCNHCLLKGDNLAKEVFTPLGAIVGTVIGVLWPTGGWHDVYRSK